MKIKTGTAPWKRRRHADSHWSFAIVNGKFAEVHWYFDPKDEVAAIWAHGFVRYRSFGKREQKQIEKDLEKNNLSWRKKRYSLLPINQIYIDRARIT